MVKKFGKKEFVVDGKTVVFDIDKDFNVDDIDEGMRRVAAEIAWASSVYAAAKHEDKMVTAFYRSMKAKRAATALLDDPKMAQWKITVSVEASDEFLEYKAKQAEAGRNVDELYGIVESLKVKASILQSRGAMSRAAFEATDMGTPEQPGRQLITQDDKALVAEGRTKNVRDKIRGTNTAGK